jgi:protein phosphatase 1 regulatory subunit 37
MCRDILNTCVRNTEEAEKRTQDAAAVAAAGGDGSSEGSRGHGKGVWGLIEDSQIARSIRKDEEKQVCNPPPPYFGVAS